MGACFPNFPIRIVKDNFLYNLRIPNMSAISVLVHRAWLSEYFEKNSPKLPIFHSEAHIIVIMDANGNN